MRRNLFFVLAGALVASACADFDLTEQDQPVTEEIGQTSKFLTTDNAIPDRYIVVLADNPTVSMADVRTQVQAAYPGDVTTNYQYALNGYAVGMSEAQARQLAADPAVKYVVEDGIVSINDTQTNATWGLDRIDQRDLPLDTTYTYNVDGTGVNAYILDTGILTSHTDFGGRAQVGTDTIGDGQNGIDCNGHGTHVAGTVGGTTWGVAKNVNLFAVRVLNCAGSGTWAQVIGGVDWVTGNAVLPAVANMSLGGGVNQALNDAVTNSVNAGIFYAVSAGNSNADACNFSPASTPNAVTVGSTDSSDARSSFSNFGTCVDIFGPGSSITSAWHTSDTATNTISGTSMSSPHIAGGAALYLGANPTATPADTEAALEDNASVDKISNVGTGSPNLLLYTLFIGDGGGDPPPTCNALSTTFASNNGQAGNMFDVEAINAISVDGFELNLRAGTWDLEIYHRAGSYVGHETNSASWTLVDTIGGVVSAGQDAATAVSLSSGVSIPAGATHSFYITSSNGTALRYTNGTSVGAVYAEDANLRIFEGLGKAHPFGASFSPRVWNGTINYSAASGGDLTSTFTSNNGQNGNMFDLVALNDITITGFDINMAAGTQTAEIYHRVGGYAGHETTSTSWALVGSTSVTSTASDVATPVPLTMSINANAGETHSFYVTLTSGSMRYTNGTSEGAVYAADDNAQILEGVGKAYPFGATFRPRVWNGTVHYDALTCQ